MLIYVFVLPPKSPNADYMSIVAVVAEAWVVIVASCGSVEVLSSVSSSEEASGPKMLVVPKVFANDEKASVIAVLYSATISASLFTSTTGTGTVVAAPDWTQAFLMNDQY